MTDTISASPSTVLYTSEWHTASTTTEPEIIKIDWSFLFKSEEEILRENAEKELIKRKENKLRLKLKRTNIFTKKHQY